MRCLWLAAAVAVIGAVGCDDGGTGEMFPDPAFKACVEDVIRIYIDNNLVEADDPELYNKIDDIECYGGGIKNLKGIENMPNIDWIAIVDNQVESLEPLRTLTKLTFLKLDNNKIKDLEPLSGLPILANLHVDYNYISDFRTLFSVKSLRNFYINMNCVTDFTQFDEIKESIPEITCDGETPPEQEPEKCQ